MSGAHHDAEHIPYPVSASVLPGANTGDMPHARPLQRRRSGRWKAMIDGAGRRGPATLSAFKTYFFSVSCSVFLSALTFVRQARTVSPKTETEAEQRHKRSLVDKKHTG